MANRPWIVAGLALLAGPVSAQSFEETKDQCVSCHAAETAAPDTPLLGGMGEKYALLQLVAFREGNRAGDVMPSIVGEFSNDDLRAAAAWVASVDPNPVPEGAADVDAAAARALSEEHRCNVCHNADYRGGDQIPPLRNQHAAYLETALQDYKAERRIGDRAAMVEIATELSDDDIQTLAYYMAHLE